MLRLRLNYSLKQFALVVPDSAEDTYAEEALGLNVTGALREDEADAVKATYLEGGFTEVSQDIFTASGDVLVRDATKTEAVALSQFARRQLYWGSYLIQPA